ncbi:hypothetical protein KVR01_006091 [Diaporthe batatas]|uniref:uncharacterized protein n=1 Tax=Diaporthe batatas TaxID=748121 RepID=UPI001D038E1C|nr:uncharacterized protein KVR01_006091 [Diaporthe batatas]KAG8164173.1 hypothetical protein KVR01_006091 [Diaporthe batatas]
MQFNIIAVVASLLAPHLTTATPVASPRGGGGSVGGGHAGGFGGGGFGGGGFGGGGGGAKGGSFSGGSISSSSGRGGSFAAGAATGYIGGIWVGHGPYHGGGGGGSSTEEPPPADCVVAKAVNKELKPSVDCFYSWEHWHYDNFLFYVIRITPTGQISKGWAQGVWDNIKGECGSNHIDFSSRESHRFHNVNEQFGESREINGTTFHGLEMTVPLDKWTPEEDEKSCVTAAIKKASCGVDLSFVNGSCYRKPGTLLAPITINGEK